VYIFKLSTLAKNALVVGMDALARPCLFEEDFVSDGFAYSQEAPFFFAEFQDLCE
jgi:hypothetical protein